MRIYLLYSTFLIITFQFYGNDTVKVVFKHKRFDFIQNQNGEVIDILEREKNNLERYEILDRGDKFNGHLFGVEVGVNRFYDINYDMYENPEDEFLELNDIKSLGINLNILTLDAGIQRHRDNLGFCGGLGLEFNNYRFKRDIVLSKTNDELLTYTERENRLQKNKLTVMYLTGSLFFEIQVPANRQNSRFFLSVGGLGGVRLSSHTKQVYKNLDNKKEKTKIRDNYNLNTFKYGVGAKLGIGNINLFGQYYFSELFENNLGPETNLYSAGIGFLF